MSPTRLVRRGSAFDRALLGAARAEVPAAGAEDRALAALGVPAFVLPLATTPASGVWRVARVWSVKWVATVLMAAAAAAGLLAVHGVPARRPSSAPALPVTVTALATATDRAQDTVPPATPAPPARAPLLTQARPAARARKLATSPSWPSARPAAVRPTEDPSALASELVLVQGATQALANHDAQSALAYLGSYEARYPHGVLAPEAGYLRVQALLARGDRAAAIDLAARLFAADPKGVLARKLEAVMESEPIP